LYEAVDQGAGKHFDDLLALKPRRWDRQAARWAWLMTSRKATDKI
jgi:hypothetical protein